MLVEADALRTAGPELARAVGAHLTREPIHAGRVPLGLAFAASPACLEPSEVQQLERFASALQVVLEQALAAIFADEDLRRRLTCRASGLWRAFLAHGAGYAHFVAFWSSQLRAFYARRPSPVLLSRPDGFFTGGKLRVFEVNVGPAPWSCLEKSCAALASQPAIARLTERWRSPESTLALCDALIGRVAQLPVAGPLVVAIPDAGGAIRNEDDRVLTARFEQRNAQVLRARPGDVAANAGRLEIRGARATLFADQTMELACFPLVARRRAKAALLSAHAAGSVFIDPSPVRGAFMKGLLALVSDGSLDRHVETAALDVVKEHFMWTRITEPGETCFHDGASGDLREGCLRRRRELVLKPAVGQCGHGIVFGDEVDDRAWRGALDAALRARDSVVQERIRPPRWTVLLVDPPLAEARVIVDTSPMIIDGAVVAVLSRFSDDPVTNFLAPRKRRVCGVLPTWMAPRQGS
jgi:hypothetical protein